MKARESRMSEWLRSKTWWRRLRWWWIYWRLPRIDEAALSVDELRELRAYRAALGDKLGNRTYSILLRRRPQRGASGGVHAKVQDGDQQ